MPIWKDLRGENPRRNWCGALSCHHCERREAVPCPWERFVAFVSCNAWRIRRSLRLFHARAAEKPPRRSDGSTSSSGIESIAALFVGLVAAEHLHFCTVALFFQHVQIPGQPMISGGCCSASSSSGASRRQAIAAAHITVDLALFLRRRRVRNVSIDVFATHRAAVRCRQFRPTMLVRQGAAARGVDNVLTYGPQPARPGRSSLVAWVGDVSAVLLIAIRTWRLDFPA